MAGITLKSLQMDIAKQFGGFTATDEGFEGLHGLLGAA